MFVSAWTDRHLNFKQHTNNRVESQHANLKRFLNNPNSSMERVVEFVDEAVRLQHIQIKHTFGTSLTKIMDPHRLVRNSNGREIFAELYRRVSHTALNLMETECNYISTLRKNNETCGCQLYTSCGLPCACRLDQIITEGGVIQLHDVDVFWRKLDFMPAFTESDATDVPGQMGMVTQEILSQSSPAVRKSMVSKVVSMIFPSKSTIKPPKVQQDTRGRPTTKQKDQRDAEKGKASVGGVLSHRILDQGRRSCYAGTSQTQHTAPTSLPRSRSTVVTTDGIPGFPLMRDDAVIDVMRFHEYIPRMFHPFVARITDVPADGHCGYAAVAVGLGYGPEAACTIRQLLVAELDGHNRDWWTEKLRLAMAEPIEKVREEIFWANPLKQADEAHYMMFPFAGLLVAQRFNVIVIFLTTAGSQTFFPMRNGPPLDPYGNYYPQRVVTLCIVRNNHFINVELQGDYPVPVINTYCRQWRTPEAHEWEVLFTDRINEYIRIRESMRAPGTRVSYVDLFM